MSDWQSFVMRVLKVPHAPEPPPGSKPRIFRAAPNYYYLKLITWILGHLVYLVVAGPLLIVATVPKVPWPVKLIFGLMAIGAMLLWLIHLTFGYVITRLDFEQRWYMISDRAIRIREGIVSVREKTIALANIQNTSVRQGPLQRLLGIADVEVRTAGGGSEGGHQKGQVGEPMHIGYFRGVSNEAEIREIIQSGVRKHKDSGLGDPEEKHHVDPAERVLEEAVALRKTLERLTVNRKP